MQNRFDLDLKHVLVYEGGYVNHPQDPGGETNFGVTKRVYDAYRANKKLKIQSVKLITSAEVREIYRIQYADKIRYDELPAGVDGVVFDGAVNSGPSQSIKWVQRAVGVAKIDGSLGEATMQAILNYSDHDVLVAKICERRMAFLKALKTFNTFGKGWTRRVDAVRKNGQLVASGSVGVSPVYFAGAEQRAYIENAKALPTKGFADALSGGGAVIVGLDQAKDILSNLSFLPNVDHAVGVLTAAGGLALAGGLGARWYYKKKEAKLLDALDLAPTEPQTNA